MVVNFIYTPSDAVREYLTDDDKAALESGKNAFIYLKVKKTEESKVDASDVTAMANKAAELKDSNGSLKKGMYINLSMWKQIEGQDDVQLENAQTDSPVTVSFTLPDELKAKNGKSRKYYILQTYNGTTYVLEAECDGTTITFLISAEMFLSGIQRL